MKKKNIGGLLESLIKQKTNQIAIKKIVIVSSGSTDSTDTIVKKFSLVHKEIILLKENKRSGKAAAINCFLKICHDPIVIIQSADTVAAPDTIENLCLPFSIKKSA